MTTGANNFKPFAVGGSANAITQSAYEALTTLIANGFLDGVADAAKVNKVLRQAAFGSAVLGEIIAANGVDALDDGDLAGFKTKLIAALNAALSITVPDASATVKGKVELATSLEAQGLTDPDRVITPLTMGDALRGANQSLSSSGYQKLLGGLIIQWGKSPEGAVTFPIAFPNELYSLVPGGIAATNVGTYITAHSLTGFTAYVGPADAVSEMFWFALGR